MTDKLSLEKKINNAGKKILDTHGLVKKTDYNAKISEIEAEGALHRCSYEKAF